VQAAEAVLLPPGVPLAQRLRALRSQAGSAGSDPCRLLIFADESVVEK